ncbi:MAG: ImmA/IrrE family metallo-endopeptidase [Acidimicrobiia bacterium]
MTTPETLERDQRVARAHEILMDRLRALTTSDQWLAMLDTARRFHTYSAHNAMLLYAQGAQGRVAGYRTWQTIPADGGGTCQVRKGANAMTILAPVTRDRVESDETTGEEHTRRALVGFKAVPVFDETALLRPPARTDVAPELLTGASPERLFDTLAGLVRGHGFRVEDSDCAPANGRTDWITRTVTVRPDLDAAQRAKTLAHELAHVRLHDPRQGPDGRVSRDRMEVEAESVAYLLCAHAGLDSAVYTIPYVAHWSAGNLDLAQETAERVIETARRLTDDIDTDLRPVADRDVAVSTIGPGPPTTETELTRGRAAHPSAAGAPRPAQLPHDLTALSRAVETDADALLARLAANPDAWGADAQTRHALQRLTHDHVPPASPKVAEARQQLGELIHHPAAPTPPDLEPPTPG